MAAVNAWEDREEEQTRKKLKDAIRSGELIVIIG